MSKCAAMHNIPPKLFTAMCTNNRFEAPRALPLPTNQRLLLNVIVFHRHFAFVNNFLATTDSKNGDNVRVN